MKGGKLELVDLDRAITENGRIDRKVLAAYGYNIGKYAERTARSGASVSKGGRPSKLDDPEVLQVAELVLSRHSKVGSKLATVSARKEKAGYFQRHSKRGEENECVPAMSLLSRPTTIYEQEPELRELFSASSWRKLLRTHYAQYRVANRQTDMCSHCQKYTELVLEWDKFRVETVAKTQTLLPQYWQAMKTFERPNPDPAAEAEAMLKYMNRHSERFREMRSGLSARDQLTLYSEIEAVAEADLRKWSAMLQAFQWPRMAANGSTTSWTSCCTPRSHPSLLVLSL